MSRKWRGGYEQKVSWKYGYGRKERREEGVGDEREIQRRYHRIKTRMGEPSIEGHREHWRGYVREMTAEIHKKENRDDVILHVICKRKTEQNV